MSGILVKRRFTVDEYERMGQAGILSEDDRVELIGGEVVAMTPIGPPHAGCVGKATKALVMAAGDSAIVHPQNPVRLGEYDEPQPDLVLLRPRVDSYTTAHPASGDTLLIVEIADSSIEYDRSVKAAIYAAAGIPEYWIADLNADLVFATCRRRVVCTNASKPVAAVSRLHRNCCRLAPSRSMRCSRRSRLSGPAPRGHWYRSTANGFTDAARRAGIHAATSARRARARSSARVET